MGKIKYIKCPRCDLNYIPDTEEMCDICKAELGLDSKIVLLDDIMDAEDEYTDEMDAVIENDDEPRVVDVDEDNDDEWRSYLDDDADEVDDEDEIPLDELKEMQDEEDELDEELDEEDDSEESEDDDFDYADPDDYTDEELDDLDDDDDDDSL